MGKYHPGALPISAIQNLSRLSILGVKLKPEVVVEGALKNRRYGLFPFYWIKADGAQRY